MNVLANRHLPPTPQDAAIARASGQALSPFAQARVPLKLRVTGSEQTAPIELPASAVALLTKILEAMAAGRDVDRPGFVGDHQLKENLINAFGFAEMTV